MNPRSALLSVALLAACHKDDPAATGSSGTDCSVITDTVPAFCGSVPKNLIFISIDTTRRDVMARYGGDGLTPNLDQLAVEGVPLDDHIQCSDWTFASTTCTLMGRTSSEAGINIRLSNAVSIPEGIEFLPRWLRDQAGMWSVLVSSNGWLSNNYGNGRDFDQVVFPGGAHLPDVANNGIARLRDHQAAEGANGRWFLHLHTLEPHIPYNPPESYLEAEAALAPIPYDLTDQSSHYGATAMWPMLSAEEQQLLLAHLLVRYAGEIQWMDDGIGETMNRLDAEGLLEDTLVVIWTDHGEQFWEHGHQSHAHDLFGEENDGIAILWAKNIVPQVWAEPTHAVDLVPTVMSLFGLDIPSTVTGLPLGTAPADRPRFASTSARQGDIDSVVLGGWRLQYRWLDGVLHLTNPGVDPAEPILDNALHADKVNELWTVLEPQVAMTATAQGHEPATPPRLP